MFNVGDGLLPTDSAWLGMTEIKNQVGMGMRSSTMVRIQRAPSVKTMTSTVTPL